MSGWQLAEVNVARLREPLDSPVMSGFVKAIADVNWLAEKSPGFVWRLRPEDGAPLVYGDIDGTKVVVTLSVWEDFASLQRFVYRTAHGLFMQRRGRWFEPIGGFTTALWWVPAGEVPAVAEGLSRIRHLRARGPSAHAFSLRLHFDPEGARIRV
ncbi:MAG: DUF3291 domain-containing protein [Acidimicrobiales bacterium]